MIALLWWLTSFTQIEIFENVSKYVLYIISFTTELKHWSILKYYKKDLSTYFLWGISFGVNKVTRNQHTCTSQACMAMDCYLIEEREEWRECLWHWKSFKRVESFTNDLFEQMQLSSWIIFILLVLEKLTKNFNTLSKHWSKP